MQNKYYKNALHVISLICGGFGFIAYFSYLLKVMFWPEGPRGVAIAIAGCLVTLVPLLCIVFFKEQREKKLFFALENIFAAAMLFYTVTFAVLVAYIVQTNSAQLKTDEIPENSAFIVFGAGLRGDQPGSVLRKRLDKAAEYLDASENSICVVSGARGPAEDYTEAFVMKKYLVEKRGISPERILEEDKARNSIQNIKLSVELMEKEGYGDYNPVSVSSSYHIPRIRLICHRMGVGGDFVLAENPNRQWLFSELVREYMSYAKLFITGVE